MGLGQDALGIGPAQDRESRAILFGPGKNGVLQTQPKYIGVQAALDLLLKAVEHGLEAGKIVLCDRYVDSSFAYQAEGRGLGDKFVASINAYAIERFTPDATIFIDLPPREAFLRKHGADKNDRMELAGEAVHERVYRGFLKQARENKERFIVVDGRKSKDEMFADILAALKQRKIIP